MKSIIFSLLVVVQTIFLVSSAHATNTDILFILDGSGSMKERIKGEAKIDSARNGLRTALAEIPKEDMVGLRIY